MSIILKTTAIRNPTPFPSSRTLSNSLFTHAQSLITGSAPLNTLAPSFVVLPFVLSIPKAFWSIPDKFQPKATPTRVHLYDQLYVVWQKQDWPSLTAIARQYLASNPLCDRMDLNNVTASAIAFFRSDLNRLRDQDIEAFFGQFPRAMLLKYVEQTLVNDCQILCDHALALQCMGLLGNFEFDLIAAIRAMGAFLLALVQFLGAAESSGWANAAIIIKFLECQVFLPWWSFEICLCRKHHDCLPVPGRLTPLEQRQSDLTARNALIGVRAATPVPILAVSAEILPRSITKDDCTCEKTELPCMPIDPCCPKIDYYVADLLQLRHWTHCYKAGDLADVEIVAAGEKRKRVHNLIETRETYSETETTQSSSEKRDHQVTDRSTLQNAIDNQISTRISASASATASANGKVLGDGWAASATLSGSYSRDTTSAIRQSQETAKEIIDSAVTDIEKSVRTLQSERITTREKEKNVHSFVNSTAAPMVTKYFYVQQECQAQLYSYGKRLMTELIIPSPARLYDKLMELRRWENVDEQISPPDITQPVAPAPIPFSYSDLSATNYIANSLQYGITDPPVPPDMTKTVTAQASYTGSKIRSGQTLSPVSVTIPDGYAISQISAAGETDWTDWEWPGYGNLISFSLGAAKFIVDPLNSSPSVILPIPQPTGSQNVNMYAEGLISCSLTLTFTCTLAGPALTQWQLSVYGPILTAYNGEVAKYQTDLQAYKDAQDAYQAARKKLYEDLKTQETQRDPFFNREIEATELKRAAIHLLCGDFSKDGALIRARPCGYPEVDRSKAEILGEEWYFWDRCLDWSYMAYAFFDYFWNRICDWPDVIDPDEPDALFKAFRRAGYARVIIPVAPGMDADFIWYAHTHQKWGQSGQPPLNPDDPRWRNVVYEMKQASDSQLTARTGYAANLQNGSLTITIKGTDIYWDADANIVDQDMIDSDIDREIILDGDTYLVAGIVQTAGSPNYDASNPNSMWWDITLDRPYDGANSPRQLFSMGAKVVAPKFSFEVPTNLIWAGNDDNCLPCYPLPPCKQ